MEPRDGNGGADIVGRHRRLGARTALIAALTLASRLLGFVREFLSAVLFGDKSPVYDAFVTAWRVPNLFRRLLGEGAASTSLQTSLTEADGDWGDAVGARLFRDVLRLAFAILSAVCVGVMALAWFAGDRMPFTGWAWLGTDPAAVRELIVRLVPYVVFICLAALAGGALAVRGRFGVASFGPAAMNLIVIATLVGLGLAFGWTGLDPADGPEGRERHLDMARVLAWGLLASGAVQLAILVPDLRATGLLGAPCVEPPPGAPNAGRVLRDAAPLALGAAVYQINVMIDGFMAQGLLSQGGPTTYYFANRIQQLPLALIATAATSAVFPVLKALGHRGELTELRRLHDRTHLEVAFFALPATAGLAALAGPITSALLEHGEFGPEGTARTAAALRWLALALLPAGAVGLVGRTFYALGDFRTPVRVSIVVLVLNVGLNVLFLVGLDRDVEGLALATVISSWLHLAILFPLLGRRLPPGSGGGGTRSLVTMLLAATACGASAALLHTPLMNGVGPIAALVLAITAGATVYGVLATVLGVPPARRWLARLRGGPGNAARG